MKTNWMGITIYDTADTIPRKIAPENAGMLRDGAVIWEGQTGFYLTPGKALRDRDFWYENREGWSRAEWMGNMWKIPVDAVRCRSDGRSPLCMVQVPVTFPLQGVAPAEEEKRMLVIHFLRKRKESDHAAKEFGAVAGTDHLSGNDCPSAAGA